MHSPHNHTLADSRSLSASSVKKIIEQTMTTKILIVLIFTKNNIKSKHFFYLIKKET